MNDRYRPENILKALCWMFVIYALAGFALWLTWR
jgi:hypothetical protein